MVKTNLEIALICMNNLYHLEFTKFVLTPGQGGDNIQGGGGGGVLVDGKGPASLPGQGQGYGGGGEGVFSDPVQPSNSGLQGVVIMEVAPKYKNVQQNN